MVHLRGMLPLRKVSPTRVALSSYYAKIFVDKSDRATFNYDKYVSDQIVAKGLNQADSTITDIRISNVADNTVKVPRIYAVLAARVASFKAGGAEYFFDYRNRFEKTFTPEEQALERDGAVLVGRIGRNPIIVDTNDVFYEASGGELRVMGRAEDLFALTAEKVPAPMAELKIFSKVIPLGVVLSYMLGFNNLVNLLGVRPRRVPNGQRMNLMPDEYAIRFLDESLIFPKDDVKSALILSGFNLYHATIRNYSVYSFDKKDIYLNLLENYGIGIRYLREIDLMTAMFIDPITKEILQWMKEPTELAALLIRAAEMLVTLYVPDRVETAPGIVEGMERERGYERFAGAVYSELVRSIRTYNARTATSSASISMNPHDVWTTIVQDPASEPINEANPIHNLKEKEVITFGGRGGRSRRSMVADSRLYKKTDEGFISEATVDSGDVAIITYVPPNANFTTVRGTVRMLNEMTDGPSSRLSTAALLAPAADRDDPKRVNISSLVS